MTMAFTKRTTRKLLPLPLLFFVFPAFLPPHSAFPPSKFSTWNNSIPPRATSSRSIPLSLALEYWVLGFRPLASVPLRRVIAFGARLGNFLALSTTLHNRLLPPLARDSWPAQDVPPFT